MKISDIPFIPLTDDELRMHGEMPALTRKRTQKGLSLRGLASLIDVAPSYLSALESGKKSNPSIRVCVAIATALDVELNTVAGWFLRADTRPLERQGGHEAARKAGRAVVDSEIRNELFTLLREVNDAETMKDSQLRDCIDELEEHVLTSRQESADRAVSEPDADAVERAAKAIRSTADAFFEGREVDQITSVKSAKQAFDRLYRQQARAALQAAADAGPCRSR